MAKQKNIKQVRDKIAENLRKILKDRYDESPDKIYLAPHDDSRIAWEHSILSFLESENKDSFEKILDEACKGTGHFIELYNGVEGIVCTD